MKTHIGQKIYCLFEDQITLEEVGYIGKDSFILANYNEYRQCARELYYEEYNKKWFRDLEKAKITLLKTRKDYKKRGLVVLEYYPGVWEIIAGPEDIQYTIDQFNNQSKK